MASNASSESFWTADRRRALKRSWYFGRFLAIHLICLAAWWTGISVTAIVLFGVLYAIRMFAITGVYHRYFAHRTYKMGRVAQFVMAFLAQTSVQKGVLWWASHHRHHHTHSDEPDDVHSPKQHGFWYAHLGWIFDPDWADTDDERIADWARYPEIVWLDRHHMVPPIFLGVVTYLIGGWSGLIVGFFWSTVVLWHATFTINSLAHVVGDRRYETGDDSRNNWFLALITFGEGWHNNHHHYQAAANQGFYWWEYDLTYYVLKALSWVGVVRDLRNPPEHVVEDEPHPAVVERRQQEEGGEEDSSAAKEKITEGVRAIQLSAARVQEEASRVQEEASRRVDRVKLAAAEKCDELSDEASQQYQELSEAASEKVDEIVETLQADSKATA